MNDKREIAIISLETHIKYGAVIGSKDVVMSANEAENILDLLKKQPEIVRCMDCKLNTGSPHNPICQEDCNTHGAYWFCADGVRKDEQ